MSGEGGRASRSATQSTDLKELTASELQAKTKLLGFAPDSFATPTKSFGSTRGSGIHTSSKSVATPAAEILKQRRSNRADLLHSPAKNPDDEYVFPDNTGPHALLSMKSTANVSGEELEAVVAMGEAAYVENKVAQTVNQFRKILTTPRGRVALKSQQYLHEMTNETIDAKRRLLYEVRHRTRVRARQMYQTLVDKLRVQAQQARLARYLAEDFDLYHQPHEAAARWGEHSSDSEQELKKTEPAPTVSEEEDLSRHVTDDEAWRDTGPSREVSLQFSESGDQDKTFGVLNISDSEEMKGTSAEESKPPQVSTQRSGSSELESGKDATPFLLQTASCNASPPAGPVEPVFEVRPY